MENNFVNQVIKFVTWIPLILAILLILVVIYAIFEPNTFPAWTGFPKTNSIFEKFLAPKTQWDWLDLVIVPFTIAFGVYL